MKIVIKDLQSGLYFKAPMQWTAFVRSACNFSTLTDALRVGRESMISAFAVLLELPMENYSIQLAKWVPPGSAISSLELATVY